LLRLYSMLPSRVSLTRNVYGTLRSTPSQSSQSNTEWPVISLRFLTRSLLRAEMRLSSQWTDTAGQLVVRRPTRDCAAIAGRSANSKGGGGAEACFGPWIGIPSVRIFHDVTKSRRASSALCKFAAAQQRFCVAARHSVVVLLKIVNSKIMNSSARQCEEGSRAWLSEHMFNHRNIIWEDVYENANRSRFLGRARRVE
jgi:hypothetical protein